MKKIYFLLLVFCLFPCVNAQSPTDRDPNFNQFNLPLNHYSVEAEVKKSKVLSDGKILLITGNKLIRLNGNLLDTSFNTGSGFSYFSGAGILHDFVVQPDGKIIVGGEFYSYNGVDVDDLIRLNQDGSIDTSFNVQGVGFENGGVTQIELQSDGKILLVARQTTQGGIYNNLKRLNSNGVLDTSFATVPNYNFGKFAIQSDGKLVVSHNTNNDFYSYVDKVARLNTDGSFDTSFSTANFSLMVGSGSQLKKILILNNGKILVGGRFNRCSSQSYVDLVRLNNNGTVDSSFQIGAGFTEGMTSYRYDYVWEIVEQQDNKIIASGTFDKFNNINKKNIVRLNVDGSIDNTFADPIGFLNIEGIKSVSFFSDQKILVSGHLGNTRKLDRFIAKLNIDGTKDSSFNNTSKGFYDIPIKTVVQTPDGKILIGGNFHSYNDRLCSSFTRLNYDGSLDNTLTFGGFNGIDVGAVTAIAPLSNGQIYLGGSFSKYNNTNAATIVRINGDGTKDSAFNISGTGFSSSGAIKKIYPLSSGLVLVGGAFTFFNDSSCSGLVRLNSIGQIWGTFDIGNNVKTIVGQNDGKILVGGALSGTTVDGIIRYTSTMGVDSTFVLDPLITSSVVNSIVVQQDGKILIEGQFTVNGVNTNFLRIFSNGTLDTSFNYSLQNSGFSIVDFILLPNQKIVLSLSDNSIYQRKMVRLNNNGTIDTTFSEQYFEGDDSPNLYCQTDGKILLYGWLLKYQGQPARSMIRLLGEDYNFVQGQTRFDSNNNDCDLNDNLFTNLKIQVVSGANNNYFIANTTGNYSTAFTNGSHTITPVFENPNYFIASPSTVNVTFPTQASPFTQNFCITANGTHPDLEVAILPVNPARPGFDAVYKLIYKNKGTNTQSGTLNLNFDDSILDLVSANPVATNQTVNNLSWNFTNLQSFETREIMLTMNVNSPMETPAVNGGDVLNYTATITSVATDETPNDNTLAFNQTVVNSFDPNDKTCLQGATIAPGEVGKYVHYMIRFENNGTANAQNIVVKDMIDTNNFDINSLVPIKGSHSFVTNISSGNKVDFIFENINLPFDNANNDGFVAFKIKTKPTLVVGNTFSNSASIYFDYNFPIVTNTATTTIAALSNHDFSFATYFMLYPNPVNDILNIETKQTIEVSSINIYNQLGQLVVVVPNAQNVSKVDVSNLASGNYFIKINSDKGTSNTKFIKQ
ncbi:hypothetical protein FLJC2902T_31350 [Flavobacterium limnosediminis JC2902]|uniref:Uncharacterized protein n=1 Tax=Flavobacterium limnosediminis JC2902 TaxID=1341181 RepID=V6SGE2_9FLAO|nr:T9SS type A sorting domain-containing protein [Flavobacterium limnosediminis]ESU25327.1 hypothetical protein FLJC2902T_31350 [Flavobacterium limnosediminis JC2902]